MSQEGEDPQRSAPFEGRYANSFRIGHNAFEFLLDFGQVSLDREEPQFHSRIITGPVFAKAFAQLLQEAIAQYERAFGVIPKEVD